MARISTPGQESHQRETITDKFVFFSQLVRQKKSIRWTKYMCECICEWDMCLKGIFATFPWWLKNVKSRPNVHTTLYGSAAGCTSIQKTCASWKHELTSKNTHSQLTCFCKSNINQTFTNGSGMVWGVRIAIFTEIRHLVEELITFLSIFGPQKFGILAAFRLNKSLSISTSNSMRGD